MMKEHDEHDDHEGYDGHMPSYNCQTCAGGRRSLRHITYLTWFRDQMITVPNFPAWVCDLCGGRDFDSRAISWLNTLLNSGGGGVPQRPSTGTGFPPGAA
ncbi:MAG TPA: YgiT-type zinc finger protein [Anaerolineales bacterium]|nr:YgiT-type zinc finger protein [Anaerolineales bacterium]